MDMKKFTNTHKEELQKFEYISQKVGKRNDYVQGGGGNISVKFGDGLMAIKASGYCLSDIRSDRAYAVLDYNKLRDFYNTNEPSNFEDVENSGSLQTKEAIKVIEGMEPLRPSVEAGFHSILDKYVLHSHSVYANLAACTKECTDIVEKALANANYSWGFVRYSDPGAKLTFSIRDEIQRIKEKNGEIPPIILMENHGLIVHHNDSQACLEIHDEVNERIARIFGITGGTFPKVAVRENEDGRLISEVPYLEESLKTGKYGMRELVEDALYPDQIVFLSGIFLITDHNSILEKNMCYADKRTGKVIFNMPQGKAQVIAETLTAVIFIRENVERSEYTLSTMGDAAKKFIENWESEKYRKSLVGK